MKRFVAIFLVIAVMSGSVIASAATVGKYNVSDWAINEIGLTMDDGLIPEGVFGQNLTKNITRGEFAAVCVKLYEECTEYELYISEDFPFVDVNEQSVIGMYISKAYNMGFVNGISSTKYNPNGLLTREQAATMLNRVWIALGLEMIAPGEERLVDHDSISLYARQAVYSMFYNNIVKGTGYYTFTPKANCQIQVALSMADRIYWSYAGLGDLRGVFTTPEWVTEETISFYPERWTGMHLKYNNGTIYFDIESVLSTGLYWYGDMDRIIEFGTASIPIFKETYGWDIPVGYVEVLGYNGDTIRFYYNPWDEYGECIYLYINDVFYGDLRPGKIQ
ncbi:S-layer homology domain-containing protein [Evtepia sp.]|uniref:S-layer homology domain-containing protein n=1 Tax=Evtepia sp. TaxID=2773933 RepID=UPI003F155C09